MSIHIYTENAIVVWVISIKLIQFDANIASAQKLEEHVQPHQRRALNRNLRQWLRVPGDAQLGLSIQCVGMVLLSFRACAL